MLFLYHHHNIVWVYQEPPEFLGLVNEVGGSGGLCLIKSSGAPEISGEGVFGGCFCYTNRTQPICEVPPKGGSKPPLRLYRRVPTKAVITPTHLPARVNFFMLLLPGQWSDLSSHGQVDFGPTQLTLDP